VSIRGIQPNLTKPQRYRFPNSWTAAV